jgi:hypothetical protein
MARIRTIKPEFWSHPVIRRRLSETAQLLGLALLNMADDEGYFRADPATVRGFANPFDEDTKRTQGALTDLSVIGYVELREHPEHGPIGRVVKFRENQKVNRPTPSRLKSYFAEAGGEKAQVPRAEPSVSPHALVTEDSHGEGKGKEGKGMEGIAREEPLATEGSDELVERILQAYPKPDESQAGQVAVIDAIRREALKLQTAKAMNSRQALDLAAKRVLELTLLYGEAVRKWPKDELSFVPHLVNWFSRGSFNEDPAGWQRKPRPGEPKPHTSLAPDQYLRALAPPPSEPEVY